MHAENSRSTCGIVNQEKHKSRQRFNALALCIAKSLARNQTQSTFNPQCISSVWPFFVLAESKYWWTKKPKPDGIWSIALGPFLVCLFEKRSGFWVFGLCCAFYFSFLHHNPLFMLSVFSSTHKHVWQQPYVYTSDAAIIYHFVRSTGCSYCDYKADWQEQCFWMQEYYTWCTDLNKESCFCIMFSNDFPYLTGAGM